MDFGGTESAAPWVRRHAQYYQLWPWNGVSGRGQNARTTGGAGILPAAILPESGCLGLFHRTAFGGLGRGLFGVFILIGVVGVGLKRLHKGAAGLEAQARAPEVGVKV